MQYYVQIFTNNALSGINTSITNYLTANPSAVVIEQQTIHDGTNYQCCLIVKI
jgi:hypothetical protein